MSESREHTISPIAGEVISGPSRIYHDLIDDLVKGKSVGELSARLPEAESLAATSNERRELLSAIGKIISLAQRNEQHQLNERSLRAVSESAVSLTELKDQQAVLKSIVVRSRELLRSEIAWLTGKTTADGDASMIAVDGANTELLRDLSGPGNVGIAGYVRCSRAPFTTHDYMADDRFNHSPLLDRAMQEEGIVSIAAVPLFSDSEVIGILVVADRYERPHHPWEISVLSTLAAHASVAIRNAQIFEQERRALDAAEKANLELEDKVAVLEYSHDAHEKLTTQLAKGSSQSEMIRVIANLLEGELAFLDPAVSVVTAYPTEALSFFESLSLETKFREEIGVAIDRSRFSGRSVSMETDRGALNVIAVSSGNNYLGSLLSRAKLPLTDHQIRIFERASTTIAVLNLLEEKKNASKFQGTRATLTDLLAPKSPGHQPSRSQVLQIGIDTTAPMVLAVINPEPSKHLFFLKKINSRLKASACVAADIGNAIVLLMNEDDALAARQLLKEHVTSEVSWSGLVALSGVIKQSESLPREYRLAICSINIAEQLGRRNEMFYYHEYAIYAPLFSSDSSVDIDAFVTATIGDLVASDRDRKTELIRTLLTFLDHQQNARETARKLKVHVNTVHNRLGAINATLGPWQLNNRALEIHLALRLFTLKGRPCSGV